MTPRTSAWKRRELDLTAILTVLAICVLGYLVRFTLNPDGVAYLDLAGAFRRGDFAHFVQGYWSPLYPVLLAALTAATGAPISTGIVLAHLINVIAVAVTVLTIWRWTRTMSSPWFGRAAFVALIVCSAQPPRVEALTPDLILLCILVCIGYQVIVRRGERWFLIGALFGAAYLTKTSVWPWLLLVMILRTAAAHGRSARVMTLRSHAVTIVAMLCWIVPISVQAGHVTAGSTGSLNYRWYLASSDARTPDTHSGGHIRYHQEPIGAGAPLVWAEFDRDVAWTYHPWSSPDDWARGVTSDEATAPTFWWLIDYWAKMAGSTLTLWLGALLVVVVAPALWIGRRPGCWRVLLAEERDSLVMMILGCVGIGQYVMVHAEPRLLAPFALLFALAFLDWRVGDRAIAGESAIRTAPPTIDRRVLSLLCVAVAVFVLIARIYNATDDERRIAAGLSQLEEANRAAFTPAAQEGAGLAGILPANAPVHPRVVIIGPALPVMANVYWLGGRIVAQLPPTGAAALGRLPAERQRDIVHRLFHDRADVLWLTNPDGEYQIVRIP